MLNVYIVGYGTMGRQVESLIDKDKHNILAIVDPNIKGSSFHSSKNTKTAKESVAICFTQASGVLGLIEELLKEKIKIVMATTGWDNDIEKAKKLVNKYDGSLIKSSNFSIGVLIYFELAKTAAKIFNKFPSYNAYLYEFHHNRKIDHPSGTLKTLGNIVAKNLTRQSKQLYNLPDRALKSDELLLSAVRGGDIAGLHNLVFESSFDKIELKHEAKNRQGFAAGAIYAAEWLADKKGFFDESDLIKSIINN